MVHPFDYETTESLQTAVTCQNKTLTVIINVKNEVDLPPYTEDRKLGIITDFMQFNYTVDEHQLDSMLVKKLLFTSELLELIYVCTSCLYLLQILIFS